MKRFFVAKISIIAVVVAGLCFAGLASSNKFSALKHKAQVRKEQFQAQSKVKKELRQKHRQEVEELKAKHRAARAEFFKDASQSTKPVNERRAFFQSQRTEMAELRERQKQELKNLVVTPH